MLEVASHGATLRRCTYPYSTPTCQKVIGVSSLRFVGVARRSERSQRIRSLSMRYEGDSRSREEVRVAEWRESERTDGLSVEWEGEDLHDATVVPGSPQGGSDTRMSHTRATLPRGTQDPTDRA